MKTFLTPVMLSEIQVYADSLENDLALPLGHPDSEPVSDELFKAIAALYMHALCNSQLTKQQTLENLLKLDISEPHA